MLRMLSIQNLAIAENLNVEFDEGLNIITGETGAGKSLLVDALSLLKGSRFETTLLRQGAPSAHVTAQFQLSPKSRVKNMLLEMGIFGSEEDPVNSITIRRSFFRAQKHRAFLNDVPVSGKALQQVCAELIDINSQFDNQNLLDAQSHMRYLDHFAGLAEQQAAFGKEFSEFVSLGKEIELLLTAQGKKKRELELLQFEYGQITEAQLKSEEWEAIQATLALGQKASIGSKICAEILDSLSEGEANCLQILKAGKRNLEKLCKLTPAGTLHVSPQRFEEVVSHLSDLAFEMQRTLQQFSIDEEQLEIANARSETYNKLLQKFGPTLASVFAHAAHCKNMLEGDKKSDAELEEKMRRAIQKSRNLINTASVLSSKRQSNLNNLSLVIEKELSELGMPKARFQCILLPNEPSAFSGILFHWLVNKVSDTELEMISTLGKFGFETAQFLLSANLGVEPQPLEKVASGGELSRIMLAIKGVLFEQESVSLFVFDEIDTGISGAVAAMVGRKLSNFCRGRQALCITHLPQVACHAHSHYIVSKRTENKKTVAKIEKANEAMRFREIAAMLSGEELTRESLAQAKALVKEAVKSYGQ